MNPSTIQTASGAKDAACPLTMLLLLAATEHPEDAVKLLKPLGVSQAELDSYAKENVGTLDTIKKMAVAGALLDRGTFARLIRVRVGLKLIETEDPRQLAALVSAAAKLPAWVFGEVEPVAKHATNGGLRNGVYPGSADQLPDITAMGMQETIAEAKRLATELEQPAKVELR